MKEKIDITSTAIMPISSAYETQIILQRHCHYDKSNGELFASSTKEQEQIVLKFLKSLEDKNLEDIYFLFISSNTVNANSEKQRCVDTTNIAMQLLKTFLESKGISKSHVINCDETLNYGLSVKKTDKFAEPNMFTDNLGYFEFLKEKNNGMNEQFWIDFEEDRCKEKREELKAEGPDEIVERGVHYIEVLRRFASYFHIKKPNCQLIIWCGTHYDLLSPLAKQTIFGYEKSDIIAVDYCGGISLEIDKSDTVVANVNGRYYPVSFEGIKPPHRHL